MSRSIRWSLVVAITCLSAGCPTPKPFDGNPDGGGLPDARAVDLAIAPHCGNGSRDANETDVDCGGGECAACAVNKGCKSNADCTSMMCRAGLCAAAPASALSFAATVAEWGEGGVHAQPADFDGDGHLDVVLASHDPLELRVRLGRGDGSFKPTVRIPVTGRITTLIARDFSGDGKPELVTADGARLEVYLNDGAGGLKMSQTFSGEAPVDVVAGDFDGDGKLDLAWAYKLDLSQFVIVLRGDGKGGFARGFGVKGDSAPQGIAAGDLDGNGYDDLAVFDAKANTTTVLLCSKQGMVRQPAINVQPFEFNLAIADTNGDKRPELISTGGSRGIVVYVNKGDGSFAPPATYGNESQGTTAGKPVLVDWDKDGKLDIVAAWTGGLFVSRGNGDGTFQPGRHVGAAVSVAPIVADWNGDGRLDCVDHDDYFYFLPGDGARLGTPIWDPGGLGMGLALGDFDRDGRSDVALSLRQNGAVPNAIDTLRNLGGGMLGEPVRIPLPGTPAALVAADFTGDGKLDLATGTGYWLAGAGDGSFGKPATFPSGGQRLGAADFDGDGLLDLVVAADSSTVDVLKSTGLASFVRIGNGASVGLSARWVVVGDLNGDRKPDLVTAASATPACSAVLNNGNGTFGAPVRCTLPGASTGLALDDVTGDGKLDLVSVFDKGVAVLPGNGDGSYQGFLQTATPGPAYAGGVALADFNFDGKLDAAITNLGGVIVMPGKGTGFFAIGGVWSGGPGATALATSDVNSDGKPDLVVLEYAAGVGVLLNTSR